MYKIKFFTDYTKEEKWLNEMSKKGYELFDAQFGYCFTKKEPEDVIYRIDYRNFKNEEDFMEYRTLFEDSGWRMVAGTKNHGRKYFKKVSESSNDDIFSDQSSKAARYKKESCYHLIFLAIDIIVALMLMLYGKILVNPKDWYLTPGLWQLKGFIFIRQFLFETPFALMRGVLYLYFPLLAVYVCYLVVKLRIHYKRSLINRF